VARPFAARLVLLYGPRVPKSDRVRSPGKQPIERNWPHMRHTEREVETHLAQGGNVGVRAGAGLVILDFDDQVAEREMLAELGPMVPTVETGRGRHHYYCTAPAGIELEARLTWRGKTAGEVQRTGSQQVVAPPSVHPATGRSYVWLVADPTALQALPEKWVAHLTGVVPDHIKALEGDTRGHTMDGDGEGWDGPDSGELIRRALGQPGARMRRNGVHFACSGCRAEGHDCAGDNGVVFLSGRFTCCVSRGDHRADIARQLGLGAQLIEAPWKGAPRIAAPWKDAPLIDAPWKGAPLKSGGQR